MPDFLSLSRVGRDRMNERKNEISFPCFRCGTGGLSSSLSLPPLSSSSSSSVVVAEAAEPSSRSDELPLLPEFWYLGHFLLWPPPPAERPTAAAAPAFELAVVMISTHSQGKKPTCVRSKKNGFLKECNVELIPF